MSGPMHLVGRMDARYVGSKENATKLLEGYTASVGKIALLDKTAFCRSITDVMSNLATAVQYNASENSFVYGDGGDAIVFPFVCNFPTRSEQEASECFHSFALAIAQFMVMSFNQLEVDLDDLNPRDPEDARMVIIETCRKAMSLAAEFIVGADAADFTRITLGPLINDVAVEGIVAVLQEIVSVQGDLDSMTISYNRNTALKEIIIIEGRLKVNIDVTAAMASYADMVIYNANIAAAVLAAKKGNYKQLKGLKQVLKCFSKHVHPSPALVNPPITPTTPAARNILSTATGGAGTVTVKGKFSV